MNGQVSTELGAYRARLDRLMGVFGEDRILFGSDWPNSDGVAPIDKVFAIAKEYFLAQPRRRRGEVLLEELRGRLQVDQARPVAAGGVTGALISPPR